jgi:hypothetical protein
MRAQTAEGGGRCARNLNEDLTALRRGRAGPSGLWLSANLSLGTEELAGKSPVGFWSVCSLLTMELANGKCTVLVQCRESSSVEKTKPSGWVGVLGNEPSR